MYIYIHSSTKTQAACAYFGQPTEDVILVVRVELRARYYRNFLAWDLELGEGMAGALDGVHILGVWLTAGDPTKMVAVPLTSRF